MFANCGVPAIPSPCRRYGLQALKSIVPCVFILHGFERCLKRGEEANIRTKRRTAEKSSSPAGSRVSASACGSARGRGVAVLVHPTERRVFQRTGRWTDTRDQRE